MTIEEAISALENIYGMLSEENKRALDVADDAMGKQVAKKVVIKTPYEMCPTCGNMYLHYHYRHCPECGQKLKWREEE